ncbi:MAG: WD40/YVTN/BNR-like repeat-containing protein [Solirubrobacterales bacterium]
MGRRRSIPRWAPFLVAVLVAVPLAIVQLSGDSESALAKCLETMAPAETGADPDAATDSDAEAPDPDSPSGECALRNAPETFADLADAHNALSQRVGADSTAEYAAAAHQHSRLTKSGPSGVSGTGGRWIPVGKGPLHADDPDYPSTYGEGFASLAGRVSDYAYDKAHSRLYAAVASGGVWESKDQGKTWRSIGNSLPTQTVGSVAYSRAAGGTLVAVTGDNAFGGNTYGGLGVYRSTNDGRTWRRSKGVPSGAMGFKAAVDPTNPRVIYAATGAGLFRSQDGGRTFRNVNLPTGKRCQGNTFGTPNCFFANVVTDVAVQAPDQFGHKGGTVLAAVGWRDGRRKNFNLIPEAPANGLYRSTTGRVGSFKRLNVSEIGFARQAHVGRVELGAASGPQQNHGYIYALVQDAVLFNRGTVEGLDAPGANVFGVTPTATPTYLNGVYVSKNFGLTWKRMADDNQMLSPTSGSVLAQLTPLGIGPGIQAWYDEWIQPDPTKQINGVPTRLVFGLEEIFENRTPTPQNGRSDFKVIGPYNANGGACLLVIASDACSEGQGADPSNTTTHPDQHAGTFIPDGKGGVTLVAGNDGGNYRQHVTGSPASDFTKEGFGKGAQAGFHTLLPYGVAAAKNGIVYAGLQDNGEIKITPNGRQVEVYGGDGVFTQVDPNRASVVYEEYPGAIINVSIDGGKTWRDISPFIDNASFYSPLVMDPRDPKHLLSGGRQIVETTAGPNTASSSNTDWKTVFDLGKSKRHKRGRVDNQVGAIGVDGKYVYAGYCGGCDPVRDRIKFFSGLATNVGGSKPPKTGTSAGWHKVPAKGLPQRFISSVTIDPRNPRTVYVTLGASDLRPYAPPHAIGADGESAAGGHIYKSTDGGRTFHDISGNLKNVPALWSVVRKGQLIVATPMGVYISGAKSGGRYVPLGHNLPPAPVFSMQKVPGHPRQLVVASLGRGVYRYTFPRGQ